MLIKKYLKKVVSLLMVIVLCVGINAKVFANETISSYENILNKVNIEYDLDLEYVPVDESEITLEQYEKEIRKIAAKQRELIDYIASKEEESSAESRNVLRASVNKTKTKPTRDLGLYFTITATYTVYDGIRIGLCRNAKLNITNKGIETNTYLTNISQPTYSIIDGGRTSTVKYTATVHFNSLIGVGGVVLYTEFYCSET